MSVIVILILASLAVAAAFLVSFIWAVKSGQFEDTYTPSLRVLTDEPAKQSAIRTRGTKQDSNPS